MRASSCVKRCASPDSSDAVKMPPASLLAARRERRLDRDALVDASSRRGRSRTCAHQRGRRDTVREFLRVGVERQDAALEVVVFDAGLRAQVAAGSRANTARGSGTGSCCAACARAGTRSRNCSPQRHCCGSARSRNRSGASSRPATCRIFSGALGIRPRLRVRRRDLAAVRERRLERRHRGGDRRP